MLSRLNKEYGLISTNTPSPLYYFYGQMPPSNHLTIMRSLLCRWPPLFKTYLPNANARDVYRYVYA